MKIGFLLSGNLDSLTGGYIYDRHLVEYLQWQGHQVELARLPGRNYGERLFNSPRLAFSSQFGQLSPDIWIQDELDHPALVLLNRRLKNLARCPIISIVHHLRSCEWRPTWQNQLYRQIEKNYLKRVDGFVFNSQTTRRTVEELLETPRPGVVACPCGNRFSETITEPEIISRARSPGPLRILFLGNIIRRKALHVLLAALANLPGRNIFLTVIGDRSVDLSYVKAIRNQIQESRLNEKIAILGSVTDAELAIRFKENHVLAVPSNYEGFGIVYLEGMGFGLPAIGTTSGGASEVITHGRDGFLVPANNATALTEYLRELDEDRDRLITLSLNAHHRFKSHPTWQNTGENILAFLQTMVRK